jgi:hypothetical protein
LASLPQNHAATEKTTFKLLSLAAQQLLQLQQQCLQRL